MNDNDPSTPSDPGGSSGAARERETVRPGPRRLLAILPAITFVLGVVLGGVVVGAEGGSDEPDTDETPSPTPTQSTTPSPGDTAVVVPQECLAVADTVDQLTQAVRDNLDAIREFRSQDIVEMLDRLEDLDQQAREQADACRDVQVDTVSPSPSTAATTEPSADSTD